MAKDKKTIRNLIIFTVLTLACGIIGKSINTPAMPVDQQAGTLVWLAAPFLVSILLRAFAGDGWKDLGLRPAIKDNGKWYLLSIFIYPLVAIIVIIIAAISGAIPRSVFSQDTISLLFEAFLLLFMGTIIKNILEEFAFRGYLAPKVYSLKLNAWLSHAIVGLIWGAWHIPFLGYVFSYLNESSATLIPRLLLGTIAASLVYGEIRIRTNSVWPAFLMHTFGGAFIGAFLLNLDILKISAKNMVFFSTGVEGILTICLFTLVGYGLIKSRLSIKEEH